MNINMITSLLGGVLLLHFLLGASLSHAQSIEDLKNGVVMISTTVDGTTRVGTGFVVKIGNKQVYILTAAHVVELDPNPEVRFFSNQNVSVPATVLHKEGNETTSLAVLVVQGKENLPSELNWLIVDKMISVSGGEDIITIGFPSGAGAWTVLKGAVASRKGGNLVIDINIDEGSSGGPLILNGHVVGLMAESTRYGFAVPADALLKYLVEAGVSGDKVTGKDGAPMVLIPAGEFTMGSREDDKSAYNNERPAHLVYLDAYYIDQYEVTTSRYAKFFQETKRAAPAHWSEQVLKQHGRKPVVGVDWNDAAAYCVWAGKRLPTEAEWEKAARATDQRLYPWGNAAPSKALANFYRCCDFKDYEVLTDVGSFEGGKSPYDAYDMAGNVWEWVADWDNEHYYSRSLERSSKGPSSSKYRVLRGGSWVSGPDDVRSAQRYRVPLTDRHADGGLRCAQNVPK